jgi:hypothetical protein
MQVDPSNYRCEGSRSILSVANSGTDIFQTDKSGSSYEELYLPQIAPARVATEDTVRMYSLTGRNLQDSISYNIYSGAHAVC